jgi:sugar lactone lactonase YvrE
MFAVLIACFTSSCASATRRRLASFARFKAELLHTRQVRLNSGLTEGPAVAPDGSIYFTDMPFGNDNGMILRYEPRTGKTSVFTDNSGQVERPGLPAGWLDGFVRRCRWRKPAAHSLGSANQGRVTLTDRFQGHRFNSPNDLCVDLKAESISPIRATAALSHANWSAKPFTVWTVTGRWLRSRVSGETNGIVLSQTRKRYMSAITATAETASAN